MERCEDCGGVIEPERIALNRSRVEYNIDHSADVTSLVPIGTKSLRATKCYACSQGVATTPVENQGHNVAPLTRDAVQRIGSAILV